MDFGNGEWRMKYENGVWGMGNQIWEWGNRVREYEKGLGIGNGE